MTEGDWGVIDDYRGRLPVKVEALIRKLGIEFERSRGLDASISGEIERRLGSKFVIRVNANDAPKRQRFTAAHELGHYMLHRLLIGNGVDDNKEYRSESVGKFSNTNITPHHETEANQFAAAILMPTKLVKTEYEQNKNVASLASRFGVSQKAMRIRLGSLGLDQDQGLGQGLGFA